MPADAADWLGHARQDLAAARALADDHGLPLRIACFLAQQAVEKAIKSLLVDAEIPFRKVHDLVVLAGLVPQPLRSELEGLDLVSMHPWAVAGRYPGEAPEATGQDVQSALTLAGVVITVADRHLGSAS